MSFRHKSSVSLVESQHEAILTFTKCLKLHFPWSEPCSLERKVSLKVTGQQFFMLQRHLWKWDFKKMAQVMRRLKSKT